MFCPNCKNILNDDFIFCPKCGNQVKNDLDNKIPDELFENEFVVQCNVCGENIGSDNEFCSSCGAKITGSEPKVKKAFTPNLVKKENKQDSSLPLNKKSDQKKKPVAVKTDAKKEKTLSEEKKININKLLFLVGGIVVVGIAVIIFSGIFKNAPVEKSNIQSQQGTQIDLATVQQINEFEENVKADTTNVTNVLQLAHRLNDSGFFLRAIDYYKMYLRAETKNADVWIDLGVCYFELKKYDEAKLNMRKGLKINPNHQIGLFNLGIVNFSQGITDSAKYWWNKALSINESSEIGKRAKQLLESN